MKIVFDTNVVLDVIGERVPFVDASTEAMTVVKKESIIRTMTANTVTDLYYLLGRGKTEQGAIKDALMKLTEALEVLDTTRGLYLQAFKSLMTGFEAALLTESARLWSAEYIVT